MASLAYLWITPGFCCHAGRRCADTHFRAMPTSHLFEGFALAVDGSELSSRKVPKLSRRYNRLKKKINTMADLTPNAWVCYVCHYENSLDVIRCTMCAMPRPRGSRSVLIAAKNSIHPAAVVARGSLGSRPPPKARGAAHTSPRESPPRGAKDKMNEQIAAQLAQRIAVPVAKVVRSPQTSPDAPLVPPPAAARAGAGIVDVTGGDSDDGDDSPSTPSRSLGQKTTGLGLRDSSPTFSPQNSPESPTDNEVSTYSFFACLAHYMDGNKISEANRTVVEVCISVEAGAAVHSMDPMKKEKKGSAFFNKYMGCLEEIKDNQFLS